MTVAVLAVVPAICSFVTLVRIIWPLAPQLRADLRSVTLGDRDQGTLTASIGTILTVVSFVAMICVVIWGFTHWSW